MKRLTTEDFILRCNIVHNNKYNYSETIFTNTRNNINIICPKHGVFVQRASNHLRGDGCSSCSGNKKLNTQIFIERAILINGDKYDYSLVEYNGFDNKVNIICPIHGVFEQTPNKHFILLRGCPKCNGGIKLDNDEFIKRSKEKHGDKYDYSLVEYEQSEKKVKIICSIHGVFEQKPRHHISGCGCQKCLESNGEKQIIKYLIANNINYIRQKFFSGCKYIKEMPFDFYLPEYNLCIEFDGKQHFESIEFFGGEESFKLRQKRDNIKTKFCIENNIKLLRISYLENIENKLKQYGFGL